MTASLQDFPSISRLIAELNGDRSGVSLYDIVSKHCTWNALPAILNKNGERQRLAFVGGSGDEINALYVATSSVDHRLKRQIPEKDSLRVSWYETKTQRFEIQCKSGPGLGVTFVCAFVIRGDAKFPVWGDPHPVKVGNTYWRLIEERTLWNSADEKIAARAQRYEQIFAARMFLATQIDWERELFYGPSPDSPKDVGRRLGHLTEALHSAW